MAAYATPSAGSASTVPPVACQARLNWLDYEWQVLLCVVVGTFMVMLDQTVVTIALPTITNVFAVPVQDSQLVITGYGLALAVIMPATGYLSDALGTGSDRGL
jgi:predicted MFS family arabinose efflux permease